MTEAWTKWENQLVNGTYPLRRFLGGSGHSVVFLTEYAAGSLADAAIKLVPADLPQPEERLARWQVAGALAHPHLVRLFESGRCQLAEREFLFVVMELADQTLSQLLPNRPLTAEEAWGLLPPALDALAFLHRRQLVQGQLKPPNFLVIGDRLKLASDTMRPARQTVGASPRPSLYDPPEAREGRVSPASDIWALGVTLIEALTQRAPTWADDRFETITVAADLPQNLADIVQRCLARNPGSRPTATELQARIGAAASAETAASVGNAASAVSATDPPTGIPASPTPIRSESPPAAAQLPSPPPAAAPPDVPMMAAARAEAMTSGPRAFEPRAEERRPAAGRRAIAPIAALVSVVVLGWAAVHMFSGRSDTGSATSPTPARPATNTPQPSNPDSATPPPTGSGPPQAATDTGPATTAAAPSASPASSSVSSSAAAGSATQGDPAIVHAEIPNVPRSARETIQGRIRIVSRVTVNEAGDVVDENLQIPGPSRYFARLASNAARKWKFAPAAAPSARVWQVQFEFTREGVSGQASAPRS